MSNKSDKSLTGRKLLFLSRLASPHVGGVERHLEGISSALAKKGYRITVITEQYDVTLPLREQNELYTVYRIPKTLQSKLQIWLWMMAHIHLFVTTDIIHAHDVFWWVLPPRFFLFWKPFFTTFHGHEGTGTPTEKAIRARKVASKLSKGNICVGEWIEKWYGTKPDAVIYGAAELSAKPPVKNVDAVFIGRLAEDTGIREYMQGIALLHGKMSLDVYGEGPLLHEVKKSVHVVYKGVTNDVARVLADHRFVFVSGYLAMIEAMQTGRYVFAQWNSPLKHDYLDSFPGSAFASVFNLPEELAQELAYVMTHPKEEQSKIAQAGTWARKQRWDKIAHIYEEIWKK